MWCLINNNFYHSFTPTASGYIYKITDFNILLVEHVTQFNQIVNLRAPELLKFKGKSDEESLELQINHIKSCIEKDTNSNIITICNQNHITNKIDISITIPFKINLTWEFNCGVHELYTIKNTIVIPLIEFAH